MLKEIKLQRFKRFSDVTISLAPFSVLMGENSSGKTTVLQAINLALVSLASFDLLSRNSSGNIVVRSNGVSLTKIPGIDLFDSREIFHGKKTRTANDANSLGTVLELQDELNNIYRLRLTSQFGGFNLKCTCGNDDLKGTASLHEGMPLFISGFVGLNAIEERVLPVALGHRLRSGHVSTVIRNLIIETKEKHSARYELLRKRLTHDFDFHLDRVEFDEQRDWYVTTQYAERHTGRKVAFDLCASGSGYLQILQILAPIYRYCPENTKVVLLDEPDAHLHPNLQATLANSLRKIACELEIQIIIATHSTSIIRAASPSEIIPITNSSKHCKPLTEKKSLENEVRSKIDSYYIAKSLISGKLLLIEDSDTSILEAYDKVLSTRVFEGANTIPIIRGRGKCDRVGFQLPAFLKELLEQEVKVTFLRDGDGMRPEDRSELAEYATERNVKLVILDRFEIENYILSGKLLHKALLNKHHNTGALSIELIDEKIDIVLADTINLTIHHYDNAIQEELSQLATLDQQWSQYRNPVASKKAANEWHATISQKQARQDLRKFGMGKEALKLVLNWLNSDIRLNLSLDDILEVLSAEDIPEEICSILSDLRSRETRECPDASDNGDSDEGTIHDIEDEHNYVFDFGGRKMPG